MNQQNLQITHVVQDYNSPLTPNFTPSNEMRPVAPQVQGGIKMNGLKAGAVTKIASMMINQGAESIAHRTGDLYLMRDLEMFTKLADTASGLYIAGAVGGLVGVGLYAAYKVADFAFQVDKNMRDRGREMTNRNEAIMRFGGFASQQTRMAGKGI